MRPALTVEFTDSEKIRFGSHVRVGGECVEWTGYTAPTGYGVFCFRSKNLRAHRVSYAAFVGPVPEGMSVCHRCDNRKCVNPAHLFLGSDRDNIQDAIAKGRFVPVTPLAPKTLCKRGHDLAANAIVGGNRRGRACRLCKQITDRARHQHQSA